MKRGLTAGDAIVAVFLTLAAAVWVVGSLYLIGQAKDYEPSTMGQIGILFLTFGPPWWAMQLVTQIVSGSDPR